MTAGANGAQTLLIDADDTLWENNIYFERAIREFHFISQSSRVLSEQCVKFS